MNQGDLIGLGERGGAEKYFDCMAKDNNPKTLLLHKGVVESTDIPDHNFKKAVPVRFDGTFLKGHYWVDPEWI